MVWFSLVLTLDKLITSNYYAGCQDLIKSQSYVVVVEAQNHSQVHLKIRFLV